jgi:hypothetical protein
MSLFVNLKHALVSTSADSFSFSVEEMNENVVRDNIATKPLPKPDLSSPVSIQKNVAQNLAALKKQLKLK